MDHTNYTDEFEVLLIQYAKGELSSQQMEKLLAYLDKDPSFHERFGEVARLYAISSATYFESNRQANFQKLSKQLQFNTSSKLRVWVGRAAACTAIIVASSMITRLMTTDADDNQNIIYTPQYCNVEATQGSKTRLTLADSTIINLNEGSSISYDALLGQNEKREVRLRGEAHFEVKKSETKTFTVQLGDISVEVLGTTFMVASNLVDTTATVSLIEGRVRVFANDNPDLETILLPGEEAVYNKNKKNIEKHQADLAAATSWLRGRFVFTNKPLHEILKSIEKRYNVKFVIKSDKLHQEKFTGSIDSSLDVEQILRHLDVDNKYRWTKDGNKIMLMDK